MTILEPRPAALVAAFALLLALLPTVPAAASHGAEIPYLALGDSVPYGWDVVTQPDTSPPDAHVGYPEVLGQRSPLVVTNASCPGETSTSFVDATAPFNNCDVVRTYIGLKADWGAATQLEYAVAFLTAHPDTGLVTLQMGANDVMDCQNDPVDGCTPAEFAGVLSTIAQNYVISLATMRATGYDGPIALMSYYVLDYADPTWVAVGQAWAGMLQSIADSGAFGDVVVANGYGAFERLAADHDGDPCAAGLILPQEGEPDPCNIHPTPFGDQALFHALHRAIDVGAIVSGWHTD